MRSNSRRIISIICYIMAAALAAGVCLLPASPLKAYAAADGTCGNDLRWTLNGGRVTVTGTGDMANYSDQNMPPWYDHADEITNVIIGEGVTSVGELAFVACNSLTNVVLSNTVKKIGVRAFKDCRKLTYINIPSNLHAIYESAFENCLSLQDIYLEEGLDIIGDKAFFRCRSLTSITVPRSVTIMGMVVFAFCDNLVRVNILAPLTELPDWTFYGCSVLNEVALPDEIKSVGDDAFYHCPDLSTVHYTGEDFEIVEAAVKSGITGSPDFGGVVNWAIDKTSTGSVTDIKTGKPGTETENNTQSKYTTVTETENAHVTLTQVVDIDGNLKVVSVNDKINATLISEDGIDDVVEAIDKAIEDRSNLSVPGTTEVVIQLRKDAEIPGDPLLKYIGKDVSIELIDESGSSLRLDMKDVKRETIAETKISPVSFDITEIETMAGIESGKIYQIDFQKDSDVNSHVGINLGSVNARHYATLYEKDGDESKPVQSVLIDNDGQASFALANVDKSTDYYVGVDASEINFKELVIPKKLESEFELVQAALPDYEKYQLTGRKSKWGITGGQYMLYVGLALGFIIIVVSIIMVSMHKMCQKRALALGLKPGEKVPSMKELRRKAEAKLAAKEKSEAARQAAEKEKAKK